MFAAAELICTEVRECIRNENIARARAHFSGNATKIARRWKKLNYYDKCQQLNASKMNVCVIASLSFVRHRTTTYNLPTLHR